MKTKRKYRVGDWSGDRMLFTDHEMIYELGCNSNIFEENLAKNKTIPSAANVKSSIFLTK
jgi:hypothetical protein